MPRQYRPKPGAKTYKKYDDDLVNQALQELRSQKSSIRSIAEKYGISFSVLQRRNIKVMKPQGGQTALTPEAEAYIVQNLNICADWGYPLEQNDLRYIVKMYLDTSNINVNRFKNNFPGPDFAVSFLHRHRDKISKRISQNIKRSRAEVSPEMMKTYFEELEKSLEDVPLGNIVNYDETNLSDDPGRQKVIVRRGCKYPERVRNFSKGCTSLMIAGNAEGELLVPYVVYKSTHLYDTWTQHGPKGTRYNRSSSGWFLGDIFSDWIQTVVIPYFDKKTGKKVLIGDNLSSHLSAHLIEICKEKDIHFVFLPANSTHLTQPLDVAFFRPMKQVWRKILQEWKQNDGRNLSSIPKGCFPRLLKLLFDQLKNNAEKNLRAGFKKTGIVPLDSEQVISRLPNTESDETNRDVIDESFLTLLKNMRYGTLNITEPRKKKKLNVVAGKSVNLDEINNEIISENLDKPTKKNKGVGKKSKVQHPNSLMFPVSLKSQIPLDPKQSVSSVNMDIETMPIILEDDLFVEREEVYIEHAETEQDTNIAVERGVNVNLDEINKEIISENLDKPTKKNKGLGKKSNVQHPNSLMFPVSLNSQIPLDPKQSVSSVDMDIETMPILSENDLFVEREEVYIEHAETEQDTNIAVDRGVSPIETNREKKVKVKILSDVIVSSNRHIKIKRKAEKENAVPIVKKKAKTSSTQNVASIPNRRDSAMSINYFDNAEEILKILED